MLLLILQTGCGGVKINESLMINESIKKAQDELVKQNFNQIMREESLRQDREGFKQLHEWAAEDIKIRKHFK